MEDKYEELVNQIVLKKVERALNEEETELNQEEYECFKKLVSQNTNLIEDTGFENEEGNYVIDGVWEEIDQKNSDGQVIGIKPVKRAELLSVMIMGKFFNIVYDEEYKQGRVDFGDKCVVDQLGEKGIRPSNFIRPDEFVDGMGVEDTDLSLEQLEEKLQVCKKERQENELSSLSVEELIQRVNNNNQTIGNNDQAIKQALIQRIIKQQQQIAEQQAEIDRLKSQKEL